MAAVCRRVGKVEMQSQVNRASLSAMDAKKATEKKTLMAPSAGFEPDELCST